MGKMKKFDNIMTTQLFGIATAILLCIILLGFAAQMLLTQKIGEGSTEWVIATSLFVSTLAGCMVSGMLQKKKALFQSVVTAAVVAALMFLGGLMMDGEFQNALIRIGSVAAGGMISCVLCLKKGKKSMRRKSAYR